MNRRRFDHLFQELSVALGELAPRYALWLHMSETGIDPEALTRSQARRYCAEHLDGFLDAHQLRLSGRLRRRLEREVARFDPRRPTPYDHMARLGGTRPGSP